MPTTFVKGDFLNETPVVDGARVFAFAADVSGEMDAGISVAVKRRWPALATWWAGRCQGGRMQLGDAASWREGEDVVYALAIEKRGAKSRVSWLERALQSMAADAAKTNLSRVSVPRLWGGATGLDPARAKRVLVDVGDTAALSLVVFEQFIRAKEDGPAAAPQAEEEPAAAEEEAPKKKTAAKNKAAAAPKKKATAKKASAKKAAAAPKKAADATPAKKASAKKAATAKKASAKKPTAMKAATAKAAPAKKATAKKKRAASS